PVPTRPIRQECSTSSSHVSFHWNCQTGASRSGQMRVMMTTAETGAIVASARYSSPREPQVCSFLAGRVREGGPIARVFRTVGCARTGRAIPWPDYHLTDPVARAAPLLMQVAARRVTPTVSARVIRGLEEPELIFSKW